MTPARPVRAPDVGLGGIKLDATAEQIRDRCKSLGTFVPAAGAGVVSCQPRVPADHDPNRWTVHSILARFDRFGRAKSLRAVGDVDPTGEQDLLRSIIGEISTAVGDEPAGGGLPWCARIGRCESNEDHAEWYFEGGHVWLRSRRDGRTYELELSHTHDDLEERVIYGLPVCN